MKLRLRVTRQAEAEMLEIALWIAVDSPTEAERWLAGMYTSLEGLTHFPQRCPLALEGELYPGAPLRQLLAGDYRAIFLLEGRSVHVLHVRHASRQPVTPDELERDLADEERPPGILLAHAA
jgi:plasmid stabilization system protein ParE